MALVADIGGTHARFAVVPILHQAQPELRGVRRLRCDSYSNLDEAVRAYYKDAGLDPSSVCTATVAVAGPVGGDRFGMTNNSWSFSRSAMQKLFGYEQFSVINDFAAVAWAIPYLRSDEYVTIGAQTADASAAVGIIGPGSGLGVGGFVRHEGIVIPLETEGGHSAFAPTDQTELQILQILARRFGRVSNERLLSGPGLTNLYRALAEIRMQPAQELSAAAISEAAVQGTDALCAETLQRFCAILGSVAGDLALTLGAKGGIYVAGGIVPKFIGFLQASEFRLRFEQKGRFHDYNAAIPTHVITAEHPGLLGAAVHRINALS
ncbi:MAG TPA: glucokinase [Gammaproteobacteria bacterium]